MTTIFYSWQSDLPEDANREFIEECIKEAIKEINKEIDKGTSKTDALLEFDCDIREIPGSPPVVQTIFDKIDKCIIFLRI